MRSYAYLLLLLAGCRSVVGLDDLSFDGAPGASGAAGLGGAAGAAGAGGGGSSGVGGSGGASGGAGATCDVGPAPNACAKCERDQCCAEVAACLSDPKCVDCVSDPSLPACWERPLARALLACANRKCSVPCVTGGTFCNPISNEGCSGGDACDLNMSNVYACFPPDNVEPLCAKCDPGGPYCAPGLACLEGQCMAYCCEDADCSGGTCDKPSIAVGQLGVCLTTSGATQCTVKLPVPSKGSCIPK